MLFITKMNVLCHWLRKRPQDKTFHPGSASSVKVIDPGFRFLKPHLSLRLAYNHIGFHLVDNNKKE